MSATQFIHDLNKCLASQSGMHYMFERMHQLDSWTNSVLAQIEILPIVSHDAGFGDQHEIITAQSIRSISRIKLSRYTQMSHKNLTFHLTSLQCPN